jgi:hypothetical protein
VPSLPAFPRDVNGVAVSVVYGENSGGTFSPAIVEADGHTNSNNYVWDANTLSWVRMAAADVSGSSNVVVTNFPSIQTVSDGGSSITVDGSVAVSNFPAIQDVSGTVAVSNFPATQTVAGSVSVSGNVGITGNVAVTGPLTDAQLRAVAVPVSIASVPSHEVTNTGTFAVQVTSAPTTTVTAADLDIRNLSSATDSVTTVPSGTQTITGVVTDGGTGKTLKSASFSLSATGTVVPAVATKRIKVFAYKVICSASLTINFRDGASTSLEGAQAMAANGGAVESVNPPAFLFATSSGNSLDLIISGTGTVAGRVSYWDDDGA